MCINMISSIDNSSNNNTVNTPNNHEVGASVKPTYQHNMFVGQL